MHRRKDLTSSLVLILLAGGWLGYCLQYPLGALDLPGPGLVPLIAGSLLLLLSVRQFLSSLPVARSASEQGAATTGEGESQELRKPLLMLAAMAVYLFTLGWTGYLLNTFLLVFLGIRIMGGRDWLRPLSVALGTALLTYLLFVSFLNVPLPQGQVVPISFGAR